MKVTYLFDRVVMIGIILMSTMVLFMACSGAGFPEWGVAKYDNSYNTYVFTQAGQVDEFKMDMSTIESTNEDGETSLHATAMWSEPWVNADKSGVQYELMVGDTVIVTTSKRSHTWRLPDEGRYVYYVRVLNMDGMISNSMTYTITRNVE